MRVFAERYTAWSAGILPDFQVGRVLFGARFLQIFKQIAHESVETVCLVGISFPRGWVGFLHFVWCNF